MEKPVPKPRRSIQQQQGERVIPGNNNGKIVVTNNKSGIVVGIASKFENLGKEAVSSFPPVASREVSHNFVVAHDTQPRVELEQQQQQQQVFEPQKQEQQQDRQQYPSEIGLDCPAGLQTDEHYVAIFKQTAVKVPENKADELNASTHEEASCTVSIVPSLQAERKLAETKDRYDEEGARTLADVNLTRRNVTSASCRVRVLPRCHEMSGKFRCSVPTTRRQQNSTAEVTTVTTNSWPQQQQKSPQRMRSSENGTTVAVLSLLERVVTTHPLWYLPSLSRTDAVHLLTPMPVGVFVIRRSSRSARDTVASPRRGHSPTATGRGITMALSIRLPPDSAAPVDHYLIESVAISGGGIGVRLEGSPYKFKSVPLLIVHYCQNGEELRTCLRLPASIMECNSLHDLKALVLQGREFWVNETSRQSATASIKQQTQQHNQLEQQLLENKSKYCHYQSEAIVDDNNNNCFEIHDKLDNEQHDNKLMENEMFESQKQIWQQQRHIPRSHMQQINPVVTTTTKRMPPIVMHNPIIMAAQQQMQVQSHECCCNCNDSGHYVPENLPPQSQHPSMAQTQCRTGIIASTSNSPTTSGKRNVKSIKPTITGQSCWYVNSKSKPQPQQQFYHKPQTSGDYQEFADLQPRHFGILKKSRSAMESFDYDSQPPSSAGSQSSSLKSKSKRSGGDAPPSGASSTVSTSSRGTGFLKNFFSSSNLNLAKAHNNDNHSVNNSKNDNWHLADGNDDYFIPPQRFSVNYYDSDVLASRDNSMTRRAKTLARRILPSFSTNSESNDNKSKLPSNRRQKNPVDDSSKILSEETIRARQLAFKRRNTDLGGASLRLAQHGAPSNNSPPREFLQKSLASGATMIAVESETASAKPKIHQKILPIFRNSSNNNNAEKNKNIRQQQSADDHQPAVHPDPHRGALVPPGGQIGANAMQKCIDELRRKRFEAAESRADDDTDNTEDSVRPTGAVVLRRNKLRTSEENQQNRRSVPDVAALLTSADGCGDTVINDGFTTPVLRRKRYADSGDAQNRENTATDEIVTRRSPAIEPYECTVVIVDEGHTNERNAKTAPNEPSNSSLSIQENPENISSDIHAIFADDSNDKMKAPVVIQHQIAPSCSSMDDENGYVISPRQDEGQEPEVDGWRTNQQQPLAGSDSSAPPPAVFRHSARLARFSTQSPQRNSKIATVRPQQHMILNSSSSSESGSPPETVKNGLRNRITVFESKNRASANVKKDDASEKLTTKELPKDDVLRRAPPVMQTPPTSASSSAVFHTANNEEARSPQAHRPSDYAQIGGDWHQYSSTTDGNAGDKTPVKNTSSSNLEVTFGNEEDTISVAGTDFNEPWDSNAWNNLLDLARFGDEKPSTALAIKALHSAETIFEEEDLSSPEELTLCAQHADYYDDDLLGSVLGDERFDSLPRSLYNGGSARGGSAEGACARQYPPVPQARQNSSSYQLQQYLKIIPERESGEFGTEYCNSNAPGSGRKSQGGSTLRSQRNSTTNTVNEQQQQNADDCCNLDNKEAGGGNVNVEMEAAAMAAVLGSCGPRPMCVTNAYAADDDGRMPAVAKLAAAGSSFSPRSAKETWRSQRNRTFHIMEDRENHPSNAADDDKNANQRHHIDALNNNKSIHGDNVRKEEQFAQPQLPKQKNAGSRFPPHRLKSSFSFSTPLAASNSANKNSSSSVVTMTSKSFGGAGGIGDSTSFCTNSYGRSRGAGAAEYGRDTHSLHRMPHNDDINASLNNLSIRLSPIISQTRFRSSNSQETEPSIILQRYVEQLASDESTLFGGTLHKFIECTVESEETDPHIVIRRVRQFLNGMKNYLVKNGQGGLHALIDRESAKLNATEFLNIDAIFETVLTKIVLVPIKGHLYHLMVFENTRNGQLQRLSENLSCVRAMDPVELGFAPGTPMPNAQTMEQVRAYLRRMQNHYSPLKKLENLLKALSLAVSRSLSVTSSTSSGFHSSSSAADCDVAGTFDSGAYAPPMRSQSGDMLIDCGGGTLDSRTTTGSSSAYRHTSTTTPLGTRHPAIMADQFVKSSGKHQSTERLTAKVDPSGVVTLSNMAKRLPSEELIRWLVYLLAKSSAINCEIEAWYMWELLPQQLLTNGEAAYYLSLLFSAVNVLKNPESIRRLAQQQQGDANLTGSLSTLHEGITSPESCDAFLRIAVPNELEGSIAYHTFPVPPQMNVTKLCRVIAHKFAITNPEDYGLYALYDNYETILLPREYPQAIHDRFIEERKTHLFAYKRRDMRIAWPKNAYVCCMPAEFQSRQSC